MKWIPWFYRGHEAVFIVHVLWALMLVAWAVWLIQQFRALP